MLKLTQWQQESQVQESRRHDGDVQKLQEAVEWKRNGWCLHIYVCVGAGRSTSWKSGWNLPLRHQEAELSYHNTCFQIAVGERRGGSHWSVHWRLTCSLLRSHAPLALFTRAITTHRVTRCPISTLTTVLNAASSASHHISSHSINLAKCYSTMPLHRRLSLILLGEYLNFIDFNTARQKRFILVFVIFACWYGSRCTLWHFKLTHAKLHLKNCAFNVPLHTLQK